MKPRRDELGSRIGRRHHGQPLTGTTAPEAAQRCRADANPWGRYVACGLNLIFSHGEYHCPKHGQMH